MKRLIIDKLVGTDNVPENYKGAIIMTLAIIAFVVLSVLLLVECTRL